MTVINSIFSADAGYQALLQQMEVDFQNGNFHGHNLDRIEMSLDEAFGDQYELISRGKHERWPSDVVAQLKSLNVWINAAKRYLNEHS